MGGGGGALWRGREVDFVWSKGAGIAFSGVECSVGCGGVMGVWVFGGVFLSVFWGAGIAVGGLGVGCWLVILCLGTVWINRIYTICV